MDTNTPDNIKVVGRGILRSQFYNTTYYLVNEMISGENTKVYSAVKFSKNNDLKKGIEKDKFSIRYFNKAWIEKEIKANVKFREENFSKYFDLLKSTFKNYSDLKHKNIQQLYDYIDDETGIYIVLEFCDTPLRDYVSIVKDPLKNTNYPIEVKLRPFMVNILEAIIYLHEEFSLPFGGLLNSSDIMVKENTGSEFGSLASVKFPHPFLSNLVTLLRIYNIEDFPSYYPPETYILFKVRQGADENKLNRAQIDNINSFDISNLFEKISQNFDVWSLGYLFYELLFDNCPFDFKKLTDATLTLKKECEYKIDPYKISPMTLRIINNSLIFEPNERINVSLLISFLDDYKKDMDNVDDLERRLKERITAKVDKKEESISFYLNKNDSYKMYV